MARKHYRQERAARRRREGPKAGKRRESVRLEERIKTYTSGLSPAQQRGRNKPGSTQRGRCR